MAAHIKVLIVDDNPIVLKLVRSAVTPHASAIIASSADDALASVRKEPPDLVVTDYAMPRMDGRQLLEALRGDKATAKIPVVLLASRAQIAEDLKPVEAMVEEFIEKPFFVGELSARLKKVVAKITLEKMAHETGEASGDVVRGNLAVMNMIDLLQSLELGRKTCALTVSAASGQRCILYFRDGQIHHAICGESKGDAAVFEVVRWSEGSFQIDFSGTSPEQTTTMSTQNLLMEGLRLLDESNAGGG